MKLLQVSLRFPPSDAYGGVPRTTYLAGKELVKRGHEVTVYTTDAYDARSRLPVEQGPTFMDGMEVHHFSSVSNFLAYRNLPIAPTMALALRKNIESFDLVHLQEYFHFQAPLVHHYATKRNIPYILQAHGSLPHSVQQANGKRVLFSKSQPKKVFDMLFGHSIIKDASKIIASSTIESSQFKNSFADFPLEKVVHLPNYIDRHSYENLPERGHFRKKHEIDDKMKIVLFLSRIHKRKGADLLITAFSRSKQEVSEQTKVVIAGQDEGYTKTLKSLAKKMGVANCVEFPGFLNEREKLEAYVDADVFVLPSKDKFESFGNVALEALACGTPVIVTNNCGVSEWISEDFGYVIKCDEKELRNALLELLQDENARKTLGNNGKEFVNKEFGWDTGVLKLEALYDSVTHETL